MYTIKTSTGSDSIVARRQVSPHTNRYLVPGLSFEGGIFNEQQTTFVPICLHGGERSIWPQILPSLGAQENAQKKLSILSFNHMW